MNHRDRDQQGRRGGREMGERNRGNRDTYNPEPQWIRQDRESRQWTGGRDDEVEYGIGGSQYGGERERSYRGSYAGSGGEWGDRDYGYDRPSQQYTGANRDFGSRDYGDRDRSRMREERDYDNRSLGGSGSGRSTYSGYGAQSRSGGGGVQDYSSGYETSGWDDELDFGAQERYQPFRVGTGMGLGQTGSTAANFGHERDFGQSYGSSSGYGSRSGWDLGTHQRDYAGERGWKQASYRGMGPSHYKRSDERIRDDIYERLTDSHHIDARGIMVDVNQGNVTLTGTVGERRMRYAAEDLVERVGGVSNINNQLRVQQQETTLQSPQASASDSTQKEDKRH